MALNIPMPEDSGGSFLKGIDSGSTLFTRMMAPVLEREKLKQQQQEFVQNLALKKQAESRANALMPYMIQQYQDTHKTAASEAQMKQLYNGLIQDALGGGAPAQMGGGGMPPQIGGAQPSSAQSGMGIFLPSAATPQPGGMPNVRQGEPDANAGQTLAAPVIGAAPVMPAQDVMQEHELRPGNPRLSKLDAIAGLVPGIPKPATHISNGMVFTTYPSGRMTVQKISGAAGQTPGEKNVSAKEASKIRDQATTLVNSANLVNQGYGLLDNNADLTGLGSGLASKFNMSNNPELGKFTTVAGKLQAELGKYASSRGGIQAVNWAANVKPSAFKPQDYNYGMFEGIRQNLEDDYNTLNQQYKAATGVDLPIPLPKMSTTRGAKGRKTAPQTGKGKVTKWKMIGGQLVKE